MILKVCSSISEIDRSSWNSLVPEYFPFAKYEFLEALESSGSLGDRTGWHPQFITAHEGNLLQGALILYLKTNSYGEYIFDWAWADAWQKSGDTYYPKLTSAIPFTPATGSKLLISKSCDYHILAKAILGKALELQNNLKCSTSHILFSLPQENKVAAELGFTLRKTFQFHWHNQAYESFDDFLNKLKQKKRQKIRRERKEIFQNNNLQIVEITGPAIQKYAPVFYELYLSTIDKKWSCDYLTPDFFSKLFFSMHENILLYLAFEDNELIAGTLNFYGGDKIYGRYWGSFKEVRHLHFELCYYRPIEFAIKKQLMIFEAGAQGEHKIQRGLIPYPTYSLHNLPETKLSSLIQQSISRETQQVEHFLNQGKDLVYKPSRKLD